MSPAATALMGLDVGDPTHEAKLNALTVPELKSVCTHFGLVSTGVKAALVNRIRAHKLAAGGGAGAAGEAAPGAEEPEEAGAAEEARPWYRQRRQGIWWR